MKIKDTFIKKEVCGVNVVVPVGESTKDYNGTIQLGKSANFVWDILKDGATEEEIIEKLLEKFDVSREVVTKDLHDFLEKLRKINCLDE